MMSVFIKGMAMPKTCTECYWHDYYGGDYQWCHACRLTGTMPIKQAETGRADDCPLVEIPEKHGDLIDRQKLIEDNKHLEYPTDGKYRADRAWAVGFNAGARHCNEHAVYAKAVIDAEGEG